MELMIKMSAAEADEAMAKGLIQALVYPFSCREEVRKAAEKSVKTKQKPVEVEKEELKEVPEAISLNAAEKKQDR
jgi:intein-encoded DNA endonuclease-like protein